MLVERRAIRKQGVERQRVLTRLLQRIDLGGEGISLLFEGQLLPESSLPFDLYLEILQRKVEDLAVLILDPGPDGKGLVGGQEPAAGFTQVDGYVWEKDIAELGPSLPLQDNLPGTGPGLCVLDTPHLIVDAVALPGNAVFVLLQRHAPRGAVVPRPVDLGSQIRVLLA